MIAYLLLLQLALAAGYVAAVLLSRQGLPARDQVRAGRLLVVLALVAPLLVLASPRGQAWRPPAQVHDAVDGGVLVQLGAPAAAQPATLRLPAPPARLDLVVAAGLVGAIVLRLLVAMRRLRRGLAPARPWRRVGVVQVLAHPDPGVAFAARSPWRAVVVLSQHTLADPARRRLALRHELQHHAAGDTAWAWLWLGLRAGLGWNPVVGAWADLAADLEELACDAAVVAHPRVSPRAYGGLLLAAATGPSPSLAGAVGLAPRSPLHRRLLMLARPPAPAPLRAALLATAGAVLLLGTTWAGRSLADDHRVSTADFQALVDHATSAGWQVPDHPVIHGHLVRMVVGSAPFYQRGLERRSDWAPLVDGALADAGLPPWLAAVPLVESGYSNWGAPGAPEPTSQAPGTIPGRGLWMFIPATAREYGLRVDDQVDQRFDPQLETAAAVALLADLHDRYGDWGLALAGYNMGPRAVDAAIRDGGTRDPWALTERGLLNEYAATVVAAALLMQQPELVE